MQKEFQTKQSDLIKMKHKQKMTKIANAITGLSRDTIAAGFVRMASDLLTTDAEVQNFIDQLVELEKEVNK